MEERSISDAENSSSCKPACKGQVCIFFWSLLKDNHFKDMMRGLKELACWSWQYMKKMNLFYEWITGTSRPSVCTFNLNRAVQSMCLETTSMLLFAFYRLDYHPAFKKYEATFKLIYTLMANLLHVQAKTHYGWSMSRWFTCSFVHSFVHSSIH